jgi:hypothetical protein
MKVKIKTESWDHTCGDGCCHSYGTDIYINDKKVSQGDYNCIDLILQEVLESLGYEIENEIEIDY